MQLEDYVGMITNETVSALLREAQFTKEMLGSGATQIRQANYASKGKYFQSFTSLSTGLERIGKLCLMLDYYIETQGQFPDSKYLKTEVGHDILAIHRRSKPIVETRSVSFRFLNNLDGAIHQSILTILSDFAKGDRYSNIDLLVGSVPRSDPIGTWFEKVDQVIFESYISNAKKAKITRNAEIIDHMMGGFARVLHTSESGGEISSVQEASFRTGMQQAVAPYRQLFVLQIIRYWVELLCDVQYKAMAIGKQDIPFFGELFAPFCNDDSYIRKRKTWDKV